MVLGAATVVVSDNSEGKIMLETRRLQPLQQEMAVRRLQSLCTQRHVLELDERQAVTEARRLGVTDARIAAALGVVRGTLRYRYGGVDGPRGRDVVEPHAQIFAVPIPRPATP